MRTRWLPLLLISTVAFARPSKPDLTMRMDDYFVQMRDFCFPSGLRVVLQEQLRERHGLVYGVQADVKKMAGQAVLGLSTATSPEASGAVVASWFGLVEAASRDVEEAAVARAKLDVAQAIGLSLASPDGVFVEVAYRIRRDEGADALASLPARLAAVDAAAVKGRAGACSGHEVVTVVGPASVEASLAAAGVAFERLP